MAENEKSNGKKAPKRINKLTNARIKKEIEFLAPMFAGIDDEDKKSLVNSLVEEAAFLKVACFQAKEELKDMYGKEFDGYLFENAMEETDKLLEGKVAVREEEIEVNRDMNERRR